MAHKKAFNWQPQSGSLTRRVIILGFASVVVFAALPLITLRNVDPSDLNPDPGCNTDAAYLDPNSFPGLVFTHLLFPRIAHSTCGENVNLTTAVVRELVDKRLLNYGALRALCLGQDSASAVFALRKLGFSSVDRVHRHPFFALKHRQLVYKLEFEPDSFDFVIVRGLDRISSPAVLVNEVEQVLKPGGIAAMLLEIDGFNAGSMVKAPIPVSSFLKSSGMAHVASLEGHTLVAFKKNFFHVSSLVQSGLPSDCRSLRRNKPFIDRMEPLVGGKVAYLPSFVDLDLSSKKRLIYVDMGQKEVANFSDSNWFLPSYPVDSRAFNVYIVDHNALVLSSYIQTPGVTFIYHPGLNVNLASRIADSPSAQYPESSDASNDDEEDFNFLAWFRETVLHTDFVVLKMNAGRAELKFLLQLFETGSICSVDELFLQCSDLNGSGFGGTCTDIFKELRSKGVFVHQWQGN